MFVYEKMWVVAGVFVNIGVRERSFMFVYERILVGSRPRWVSRFVGHRQADESLI